MSFGLRFSRIAAEKLLKVPNVIANQIETGLKSLADDPAKCSRRAVCPPFPPFGHQCDIRCKEGPHFKYNCVVLFVYSDCGQFIDIHRMIIQPVGNSPGQEKSAEAESSSENRE